MTCFFLIAETWGKSCWDTTNTSAACGGNTLDHVYTPFPEYNRPSLMTSSANQITSQFCLCPHLGRNSSKVDQWCEPCSTVQTNQAWPYFTTLALQSGMCFSCLRVSSRKNVVLKTPIVAGTTAEAILSTLQGVCVCVCVCVCLSVDTFSQLCYSHARCSQDILKVGSGPGDIFCSWEAKFEDECGLTPEYWVLM